MPTIINFEDPKTCIAGSISDLANSLFPGIKNQRTDDFVSNVYQNILDLERGIDPQLALIGLRESAVRLAASQRFDNAAKALESVAIFYAERFPPEPARTTHVHGGAALLQRYEA